MCRENLSSIKLALHASYVDFQVSLELCKISLFALSDIQFKLFSRDPQTIVSFCRLATRHPSSTVGKTPLLSFVGTLEQKNRSAFHKLLFFHPTSFLRNNLKKGETWCNNSFLVLRKAGARLLYVAVNRKCGSKFLNK